MQSCGVKVALRGGSSVTRIDLTKERCSALAEYLRSLLNNGMGAGCFGKIEMLVLAYRALSAAEEIPEEPAPPVPPLKHQDGPGVMRMRRLPRRPQRRLS